MPAKTKGVVALIGFDQPRGPQNSSSHPWRRSHRHGVVSVERAPGVARDVASRPLTPEERAARDESVMNSLETASASVVGLQMGTSRSAVLAIAYRYRQAHGLEPIGNNVLKLARREAIVSALQDETAAEVAARFGIAIRTVRDIAFGARAAQKVRSTSTSPSVPRTLPKASISTPRPATPPTVICEPVDRVSLLDVGVEQCRDLDDDRMCCGAPVVPGRSWCPTHFALYTQPLTRRRPTDA